MLKTFLRMCCQRTREPASENEQIAEEEPTDNKWLSHLFHCRIRKNNDSFGSRVVRRFSREPEIIYDIPHLSTLDIRLVQLCADCTVNIDAKRTDNVLCAQCSQIFTTM